MMKRAGFAPRAPELTGPAARELFEAITQLASAEEAADFLRDLCTAQELQSLSMRWQVARMLDQGLHYQAITAQTGASPATISRVNTWLRFGRGGYRKMLDRGRP